VGGSQGEIEAAKAREIEAHDECRGAKENGGGAAEKMGSGEGEENRLTSNDKAALTTEIGRWSHICDFDRE